MSQIVFKNPIVSAGPTLTGIGNGTLSVDRLTHFTIAQDYTLTCIVKSPDTLFSVVGSLDGSVGIATVGTQFFDEELKIFLTIQQGATVFEVGDQFTLTVENGTDLNQENIDDYDELPQKNFGAGTLGLAQGDHNLRYSNTALAAYRHIQELRFLADATGVGGNAITVQFLQYAPAVAASKVIQDLTYTGDTPGAAGNSITVEYVGDGLAGAETVGVVGTAITVHIESSVSTATQVKAAVDAHGPAAALVNVAISGTGSNAQTSVGATALENGADAIGLAGFEFVSVAGTAITVRLESGVSTATQVKAAVDASGPASALISVSIVGNASSPMFPMSGALALQGGKNKNYALNHNEQTDSGSFLEGNANARVQDLIARGTAAISGDAQVGGMLGLADSVVEHDSGPAIPNVQQAINRLIDNKHLEIHTSDGSLVSWASNQLTFSANILFAFRTGSVINTVASSGSPISLSDGYSLYVLLNPGLSTTIATATAATVPQLPNVFRLATRVGSVLIWFNGTSMLTGETGRVGQDGSTASATASTMMRRDSSANSALNKLTVNTGGANGVDVAAAGDMYVGASIGANTMKLGGASSTVEILGNLIVQGTTTTLNTTTLDVEDINIAVNKGGNDASSEGAGLTVDRTGTKGSIIYAAAAATKFKAGNLGAEVELVDLTTQQTLENKWVADSSFRVIGVDPTKYILFDASGTTGTGTALRGNQTVDRVLQLPDADDTLMGKATTDTMTNKTAAVTGAGNHFTGTLGKVAAFNPATGDLEASALNTTSVLTTAAYRASSAALTSGDSSKAVVFSSTLGTTSYRVSAQLVNVTDGSVQFQPVTITAKSATGFTATWNAGVDSNNYVLEYIAMLDS
jgi:hypothetical protein